MELPNREITDANQVLWELSLMLEVMYNDSALASDLGRPLHCGKYTISYLDLLDFKI